MKLQCGVVAIIITCVLLSGGVFIGGYTIGKNKQTTIIQNISNTSQAISQSVAISGVINLTSRGNNAILNLDIKGTTNITASTISNGITNEIPFQLNIK